MNKNENKKFVIPPGFFDQHEQFHCIQTYQSAIEAAKNATDFVCKNMAPIIHSNRFKEETSSSVDQFFLLKELKGNTLVESDEDLEFTGNTLFEAVIKRSVLRSLKNQGPVAITYHIFLPKDHDYFSKKDVELQDLIADISKETEPSGFFFRFANRQHVHDLCISAVYHYDKVAD